MTELVVADIGGTHARFAIAEIADGGVRAIGTPVKLRTADHASLQTAWEAFAAAAGRTLPRAVSLAVASPVGGEVIKFTNNPWVIRPPLIPERLGVDDYILVNDFDAVGHAVAKLPSEDFHHLCGPERDWAPEETVSIVGPGTGLGVAQLLLRRDRYEVLATEGGHSDFAPLDSVEDEILSFLRQRLGRVSVERIVSGPGLVAIHAALAALEGRDVEAGDEIALWTRALAGSDSLANAALDRLCLSLGAVAGDIALTHGASAVVIAGGLGRRLADHLPQSGFAERFVAKGRFERLMSGLPVKLMMHPEPGLYGAAVAFAHERPATQETRQ